jgi:CheY-like chemotaxis protein
MTESTATVRSILLVEDDRELCEELADALRTQGFEVFPTANGREALARLAHDGAPPSVILTDLLMPVMNGWELRAALKERSETARIPVVVMSGAVSRDPRSPYYIDVDDFVTKPINLDDLLMKLRRLHGDARREAAAE